MTRSRDPGPDPGSRFFAALQNSGTPPPNCMPLICVGNRPLAVVEHSINLLGMGPIQAFGVTIVIVPVYDWLVITGSSARMFSDDFQYWPPTRLRITSIIALAAGGFGTLFMTRQGDADDRL